MTDLRQSAPKRVALCADDFGLGDAANRAILELGASGALTATSVAVDGPYIDAHIEALRGLRDRLSIGLHLNVTENPRFPEPRGVQGWIVASWLHRLDRDRLVREIHRQLDRFETLLGGPPTHVDGHEHVHQFPGLREPLLDAIAARYGAATVVRCTWPRRFRGVKAAIIGLLGAHALQRGVSKRGLRCNSDFAGAYDLQATTGFESRMDAWLRSIRDGGLIMCHPEALDTRANPARQHEYEFLRSPEWPRLLKRLNIDLVRPDAA